MVSTQYSAVHRTLHDRQISGSFNLAMFSPSLSIAGIFGRFCMKLVAVPTNDVAAVFALGTTETMLIHSLDPTGELTSVDFLLRFDWHILSDTSGRSGPVTIGDGQYSVSSIAQDSCESRRTDRHWWVKHCWYLRHLRILDNHLF